MTSILARLQRLIRHLSDVGKILISFFTQRLKICCAKTNAKIRVFVRSVTFGSSSDIYPILFMGTVGTRVKHTMYVSPYVGTVPHDDRKSETKRLAIFWKAK